MSKFSTGILKLIEDNLDDPQAEQAILLLRQPMGVLSQNRNSDQQHMSDLLRQVRGLRPATIQPKKEGNKTISFSSDEFLAPKTPTQPVPVADIEVKAQQSNTVNQFAKEVFELYGLGEEQAEAKYETLEAFIEYTTSIGCIYKKKPKTFKAAWAMFAEYFISMSS